MFLSCVEGNNGLQHTQSRISLWLRTLHRPKCMEKTVSLSVDWEEKEPFGPAGKLSGRPWRSEGLVKAPYSRGRLIKLETLEGSRNSPS